MDTRRLGKGMWIVMWLLVLGLLTLVFDSMLEKQRNPNTEPTSYSDGAVREVVLQRNRYGHYIANGTINGSQVEFLLDTGATSVAVPADIASRLGLREGAQVQFQTANGSTYGYLTWLDHVGLGEIRLDDVRASINPSMDGDSVLLGMTFLKHLEFTQRGDTLILRQYQ
jgi:aspartyl protease family protein